jgi:hypothetical protein
MTPEERYARIDARLDAIAMHLKLAASVAQANEEKLEKVLAALDRDGEYIRALARIAEIHEHRLSDLEGGGERKN